MEVLKSEEYGSFDEFFDAQVDKLMADEEHSSKIQSDVCISEEVLETAITDAGYVVDAYKEACRRIYLTYEHLFTDPKGWVMRPEMYRIYCDAHELEGKLEAER
jgi:hypothetical protein